MALSDQCQYQVEVIAANFETFRKTIGLYTIWQVEHCANGLVWSYAQVIRALVCI